MLEDSEIPKSKKVFVAAVLEWDKEFTSQGWNVYLINDREDEISSVLVMSRGKSSEKKTSTLRHDLGDIPPKSSAKVEIIISEVFGFTNEYLVTFFANNKLHEGTFIFEPNSISEQEVQNIPVMEVEGILANF